MNTEKINKRVVILRFLRNKAIEVGIAIKWMVVICAILVFGSYLFFELCYIIGKECRKSEFMDNIFLFGDSYHKIDVAQEGFWVIVMPLLVCVMFLCIGLLLWFLFSELISWLKENWERAKEETGYKN